MNFIIIKPYVLVRLCVCFISPSSQRNSKTNDTKFKNPDSELFENPLKPVSFFKELIKVSIGKRATDLHAVKVGGPKKFYYLGHYIHCQLRFLDDMAFSKDVL